MTDQVYSMGWNETKECGQEEKNVLVPTLVPILEGLRLSRLLLGIRKPSS